MDDDLGVSPWLWKPPSIIIIYLYKYNFYVTRREWAFAGISEPLLWSQVVNVGCTRNLWEFSGEAWHEGRIYGEIFWAALFSDKQRRSSAYVSGQSSKGKGSN